MKFCKDCRFCILRNETILFWRCTNPVLITPSPVTGETAIAFCDLERVSQSSLCGPKGLLFDAKEDTIRDSQQKGDINEASSS